MKAKNTGDRVSLIVVAGQELLLPKEKTGRAWRQHFSTPAADLIALVSALAGFDQKDVLLRCFKRSRRGNRINEPTVLAVLQEIADEAEGREKAVARRLRERERFMAQRAAERAKEGK